MEMVTFWYFQAVLLGWLKSLFSRFFHYILWKNPNELSGQLSRLRGCPGAGRGRCLPELTWQMAAGKFARFVLPGLLLLKKGYILSYYSAYFRHFLPVEASASFGGSSEGSVHSSSHTNGCLTSWPHACCGGSF